MKMNGSMYRDMVVSAACSLDNQKDTINNLNVFPVPDGDTGINMSLTMSGVRGDFVSFTGTLGECAQKAANLMLRGARGNSGVILSLFFRGIAKAWAHVEEAADCREIVKGFSRGVAEAYKAVMNPTEGTILTVMRVMTEKAAEKIEEEQWEENLQELFDLMLQAAKDTLQQTPELLPILKQAGVVDSGGCGFVAVIEGMKACLDGHPITAAESENRQNGGADFRAFQTEDIRYAYCTECIVGKSPRYAGENTTKDLHRFIMKLGDSVVYVDDSELIKLHVHTNDPGRVLTEALRYGSLETVKIENMKQQHSSLSDAAQTAVPAPQIAMPEKEYGFVTVCMGQGMEDLFRDLAADRIVCGGQTMNPSTDEIVDAVQKTPAKTVFVLPNNKNIYMVSQQAAKIVKDRRVVVLNTASVPEGVAAMLAFDPETDCKNNEAAMQAAIEHVTTLSITYAVRDTEIGETVIKEGEILGLINGKIACSSATREECVRSMIESVPEASVVTVYYGEGVTEAQAEAVSTLIQKRYPDAEVMTLNGAQPVYSYIISIE